ncbi:hypothetical protein BJB45_21630 [Halomonas huangheensis]|uniref:Uncharacterized protein n=1 Tax=Halomonas huangheensis TaxID=1178482 RepID=W1N326_9GAMM|nr:hypothetical protein BJB45_21630 [Halomonas huangheensis]
MMLVARWPLRSNPAKSQFELPGAPELPDPPPLEDACR